MAIKPEDIAEAVSIEEEDFTETESRMEHDYDRWRLKWSDPRNEAQAEGYQTYTSNEPRTYADKIIDWLVRAAMVIRIPDTGQGPEKKDEGTLKEDFILGALRSADNHLRKLVQPIVRDQLAWYISLRGWFGGRCTFVKDKDGKVRVEIIPWDPMNTFYNIDDRGLLWAVHRVRRTNQQIKNTYGIDIDGKPVKPRDSDNPGTTDERLGAFVYHRYSREQHSISLEDRWIKRPKDHNFPSNPVFLGPVGPTPLTHSDSTSHTSVDVGESVFAANRATYDFFNMTMSDMMTLVRRSVKQPLKIKSKMGNKTLDGDPYAEGTQLSLADGDDVETLGLLEMARETAGFLGNVSGEMQRGAIAHTNFGELQFQLSGFAINTLKEGTQTAVSPRIRALESAYCQITQLIMEQYGTGDFGPITLEGRRYSGDFFRQVFKPADIEGNECPVITFLPQLPEDDVSKFAIAQIARDGPVPLLADDEIKERILGVQDVAASNSMILAQQAVRGSPIALLYSFMISAQEQGRDDLARIYLFQLMQMVSGGAGLPGAPGPQQNGGGPPGINPAAAPPAMMGVPPPVPTPQGALGLVPPGQQRPGALTNEQRLGNIGLVPGR